MEKSFFDLVILDINLPDGKKYDMIDDLRELQEDVKILIFSAHEEEIYAFRYMQAGVNGYLNKFNESDTIIKAVKTVLEVGKYISVDILDKLKIRKRRLIPLRILPSVNLKLQGFL